MLKESETSEEESKWSGHWELLQMMSITHQEAMSNDDYKDNCYEPLDILSNLGGLTLVSPEFFSFGEKLMNAVGSAVTDQKIVLTGTQCMELGRKVVQENGELIQAFLDCSSSSALGEEDKLEMYEDIVCKVCNARFGTVLKAHKDRTIGRQGSQRSDEPLRARLKSVTSNEAGK